MKSDGLLYVHVPFCLKKCRYCDFYSGTFSAEDVKTYEDNILSEIEESPCRFSGGVSSLFFGGGTPSCLPSDVLVHILEALRKKFVFLPDAEISVECNPGTVTAEKLNDYYKHGVNRLSFGLQSADNRLLEKIGRIHTVEAFTESYRLAKETGFTNLNIDLMAGLPTDTVSNFLKTLTFAVEAKPTHLSLYSLILEEGTEFYDWYGNAKAPLFSELPSEEDEREMIHRGKRFLEDNGYRQYEISNFALPGYSCRQNIGYWSQKPYIGFGPAAASFDGQNRFQNAFSKAYRNLPRIETETLSKADLEKEYLMLRFRMTEGVWKEEFRERFGEDATVLFREELSRLIREKLIEENDKRIFLTPLGLDLANLVFAEFVG